MRPLTPLAVVAALLASAGRAEDELPVYPGAVHTRIGDALRIDGSTYQLAYFVTPDPLPRVAAHFLRTWSVEGLPVTVDGDGVRESVLGAFDTRRGIQLGVVLRLHEGKTLGLTIVRDGRAPPPPAAPEAANPEAQPLLEGTLYGEELASAGSSSRTALLEGTLEQVRDRLVRAFALQGFSVANERGAPGQRLLTLQKAGEELVAVLAEVDGVLTAVTWARRAEVPTR